MALLSTFLILALSGTSAANAVTHNFKLSNKIISPDGYSRSAALVNGQFPGPLLTATKGDCLMVKVDNQLTDPTMRRSTSINWHGIVQTRNAQDDGAAFVTQCPIAPGHSYTYKVELNEQAGTFWYHSHLSTQDADGLRGPMVIYDPHDPMRHFYDIDDENTVITLADWFHLSALQTTNAFLSGKGSEPDPDSGLINGMGRYSGGPAVPRARINVVYGKRYRFRIVSMAVAGVFEFSISSHSMTVIEADGIMHRPYTVNSIPVLPGQRYSAVVTTKQAIDNYWIRATMTSKGNSTSQTNPNFNGTDTFAILHYADASDTEPSAPQPAGVSPGDVEFEEYKLQPLENPGSPGGPNPPDLHVFNFTYNFASPNGNVWVINGIQYHAPAVPTLLNILANGFTNESQFGRNESTIVLARNAVIEVVLTGTAGHAFHLHGHTFDVVQSASGGPPNFKNPPRRDVVASGNEPVRIRFVANNSGPWFLHCHLEYHFAAGLAAVFVEDPQGIRNGPQAIRPNRQWEDLCNIYNKLDPSLQ